MKNQRVVSLENNDGGKNVSVKRTRSDDMMV